MSWVMSGLFALTALYGNAAILYAASHPDVYAGTYAIRICKGPCAQSAPASYVTGVLVLFDKPVRNSVGRVFRAELDREPVNGCFVLKDPGVTPSSLAEIAPEGFFSWALFPPANAVLFQLSRSPDGGYGVSLKLAAKGLSGTEKIWGGAVGAVSVRGSYPPADSVVADRVGEADIKQCPSLP
jgi:hypothetical protein